jgi:hypothetical protein
LDAESLKDNVATVSNQPASLIQASVWVNLMKVPDSCIAMTVIRARDRLVAA